MKRPNNAGSVYKLSGKRRKPWAAAVTLGYDDDGKRKYKTTTHATKADALKALALFSDNMTDRPNIKLKELYDEWSEKHFQRVTKKTEEDYEYAYSKISILNNKKFSDLRTKHFQTIIDNMHLSYSAHHKVKTLVNLLYKYAEENDIVNKNYGSFIKIPKSHKKEKERFSEEDIKKLKKHSYEHNVMLILCMIFTGFRPTAFFSLTKESYNEKYNILIGGIKTEAGINRVVPINSNIQYYIDYFLSLNGETLFCRKDGKAYTNLRNFREREYKPALELCKVRYLPPMRTRHTFSSLMVKYNVKKLAHTKMMGHTKYSMSADVYSHIDAADLNKEIEKIPDIR